MTECQHEIGRRAFGGLPGHPQIHPSGPQFCLRCGKTLEGLFTEAQREAMTNAATVAREYEGPNWGEDPPRDYRFFVARAILTERDRRFPKEPPNAR